MLSRRALFGAMVLPALRGADGAWRELFDGKTLKGWIQDTPGVWRVEDGCIVGETQGLKWNDFLRTRESFGDFEFVCEFLLKDGAGNSGIQFRSSPADKAHEVSGYQADIGDKYWGALYDESRRNRVLVEPNPPLWQTVEKSSWHEYRIRAQGPHIELFFDSKRTVDYTEPDAGIAREGFLALQVHSGPPTKATFRKLRIRTLG